MRRHNSSIFSFSRRPYARIQAVFTTWLWTLAALVALDAAVGWGFPLPADINQTPSQLARYFDYGRSIDGKLTNLVGPTDARTASIVLAGWIDRECRQAPPQLPPGRIGVTVYGMSFSNHIADQLEKLDPTLAITRYAGPAAPPNHSYACYEAVSAAGGDRNQVQVIGVLASALPRLLTLGGLTTSFEAPMPFSYPRYRLVSGKLIAEQPVIRLPEDLREPEKMASYRSQLVAADAFYDPWLMDEAWADRSVMLRLLRRSYAQSALARRTTQLVSDGKNYTDNADIGPALVTMLTQFAAAERAQGKLPIVLLFQDRGSGADSLYRLVGSALEELGVPVVSSHEIAPVSDPRNFISDGHFTPTVDRLIAERTLQVIRQNVK